ncbi:MAG: suppressor of fused domain protein [Acidimicrobiales bacterium]
MLPAGSSRTLSVPGIGWPAGVRSGQSGRAPDEAPGWDAIDAALRPVVEDRVPDHWSTGSGLPDQGRLWGIRAYRFVDHVLYVTYGLSELFMKVSDDEAVSGWGAGLTMRVVPPSGDRPPTWPVRLLARLGELVF